MKEHIVCMHYTYGYIQVSTGKLRHLHVTHLRTLTDRINYVYKIVYLQKVCCLLFF